MIIPVERCAVKHFLALDFAACAVLKRLVLYEIGRNMSAHFAHGLRGIFLGVDFPGCVRLFMKFCIAGKLDNV